jgi:hypothetical protein
MCGRYTLTDPAIVRQRLLDTFGLNLPVDTKPRAESGSAQPPGPTLAGDHYLLEIISRPLRAYSGRR